MVTTDSQSLSDIEVVDRVLAGETGLYELLMRRYNQRLYRVVRSVIPDDAEAEDILQEAWVSAYQHLAQFEHRSSFATWVTRIAYYEALARAKRARRWTPIENAEGQIMPEASRHSAGDTPESDAMRLQLHQILQTAVDTLPESYRTIFILREVEELSTSDTAECLGLSEEAVKTRLHRGRAMLRKELAARFGPALPRAYSFMGTRCDSTVAAVMVRIRRMPDGVGPVSNSPKPGC